MCYFIVIQRWNTLECLVMIGGTVHTK